MRQVVDVLPLASTTNSLVSGAVVVKCAQSGGLERAKVAELSNIDGNSVKESQLVAGASLLLDVNGKSYPVTFMCYEGM